MQTKLRSFILNVTIYNINISMRNAKNIAVPLVLFVFLKIKVDLFYLCKKMHFIMLRIC